MSYLILIQRRKRRQNAVGIRNRGGRRMLNMHLLVIDSVEIYCVVSAEWGQTRLYAHIKTFPIDKTEFNSGAKRRVHNWLKHSMSCVVMCICCTCTTLYSVCLRDVSKFVIWHYVILGAAIFTIKSLDGCSMFIIWKLRMTRAIALPHIREYASHSFGTIS